jgi:hypothetical protein
LKPGAVIGILSIAVESRWAKRTRHPAYGSGVGLK